MPEMHLRVPGFTYSDCGPFTKNEGRIQKFKETGDSRCIYQNELDKACAQHDMAYGDFKDLARRTASDKILPDKTFNIGKNLKYDGYQRGLAPMVYKFFDEKSALLADKSYPGGAIQNEMMSNKGLSEALHKPKKYLVYSFFIDNIWGTDLADMQLINKFNKGIRFLLCVIDIFSKSARVIHLKDKKGTKATNTFQKFLDELNCKPNKNG